MRKSVYRVTFPTGKVEGKLIYLRDRNTTLCCLKMAENAEWILSFYDHFIFHLGEGNCYAPFSFVEKFIDCVCRYGEGRRTEIIGIGPKILREFFRETDQYNLALQYLKQAKERLGA